ncbi:MAG: hypothetical protein NZO16_06420 [Deltaproteobacteria bacterium]|nr:hypothetical protein [Deltaproteobacteria bacterium]
MRDPQELHFRFFGYGIISQDLQMGPTQERSQIIHVFNARNILTTMRVS